MLTLQQAVTPVYLSDGARDWDAEDAAHAAWVAGYERRVREQARWYGLALAGMGRDGHHARGRRTADAIRRDFARWVAALAKFDGIAADALKREVSDLMDLRERHPEPASVSPDPESDPDEAFESAYQTAMGGRWDAPPPLGFDVYERRAWALGVRAAVVDLEAEDK